MYFDLGVFIRREYHIAELFGNLKVLAVSYTDLSAHISLGNKA